jgi:hypothetical protein
MSHGTERQKLLLAYRLDPGSRPIPAPIPLSNPSQIFRNAMESETAQTVPSSRRFPERATSRSCNSHRSFRTQGHAVVLRTESYAAPRFRDDRAVSFHNHHPQIKCSHPDFSVRLFSCTSDRLASSLSYSAPCRPIDMLGRPPALPRYRLNPENINWNKWGIVMCFQLSIVIMNSCAIRMPKEKDKKNAAGTT